MYYSQFRENERTARFEVKLVPGHRCVLIDSTIASVETSSKPRAKKSVADSAAWAIGGREDETWVDLESELRRIRERISVDFGLRSGDEAGAGQELSLRLEKVLSGLYRNEAEDYLSYLGLLNIFEYFRLVQRIKHFERDTTSARQLGLIGDEFFACRKLALEHDVAELTEWLVAHAVGIPNLAVFYPEEYSLETEKSTATKKRTRKKTTSEVEGAVGAAGDGSIASPESEQSAEMPAVVAHVVELIRLQQATTGDLIHYVDEVMQRLQLESPSEAIAKMTELLPGVDQDFLERQYNSFKVEQARETERQQASIERQRQIFEKRPKRGAHNGKHERQRRSPLEEFAESIEEDPEAVYEAAMQQALASELVEDNEEADSEPNDVVNGSDAEEMSAEEPPAIEQAREEGDEPQAEMFGGNGELHQPYPDQSRRRRRRQRHGRGPTIPPPKPSGRSSAPRKERQRPHREGGQPNFDEIQPMSNYSPGLTPPPNSSAAVLSGAAPGKKKWRRRK